MGAHATINMKSLGQDDLVINVGIKLKPLNNWNEVDFRLKPKVLKINK